MFHLARKVLTAPVEVAAEGAAIAAEGAAVAAAGAVGAAALTAEAAAEVATDAAVVAADATIGAAAVTAGAAAVVATGAATLVGDAAALLANTIEVDGFRIPSFFDPDVFRDARRYKPGRGRVVVVSNPKCGTTWMSQIVSLIQRRGLAAATAEEFFSLVQLLEVTPLSNLQGLSKEGCIKTHLPFDRATFSRDAKYIYIARHPAHCVVDFYQHMVNFPLAMFEGAFDVFFDLFLGGSVGFGDYFDHLLSWYELRNEPNVLFVPYESLKYDLRGTILQVARFMGDDCYNMLLEDGELVLRNVLQYSSWDYMTQTVGKFYEDLFYNPPSQKLQSHFPFLRTFARGIQSILGGRRAFGGLHRKGSVEIVLTVEQKERLNCRIREKCGNSAVVRLWRKPRTIDAGGVRILRIFDLTTFHEARQYRPSDGRVVVAAYPGCGTTWISQIISLILRRGKPAASAEEHFRLVKFLEATPLSFLQGLPKEGCLHTHLPVEQINFSRDAKYIYVMRNPADAVVDFYSDLATHPGYLHEGTFDEFFESFLEGDVEFGDYFDHLLSWYERRNEPNVLFVTNESLQENQRDTILQIARFMGEECLDLLMAGGEMVLKQVLQFSSLSFMQQTISKFYDVAYGGHPSAELQAEFPFLLNYAQGLQEASEEGYTSVRSCQKQGNAKYALTTEQRQRLESRMQEKLGSAYTEWSTMVTASYTCSSTTIVRGRSVEGGQTGSTTVVRTSTMEGGETDSQSSTVVRTSTVEGGETDSQCTTYTTTTTTSRVIVREN